MCLLCWTYRMTDAYTTSPLCPHLPLTYPQPHTCALPSPCTCVATARSTPHPHHHTTTTFLPGRFCPSYTHTPLHILPFYYLWVGHTPHCAYCLYPHSYLGWCCLLLPTFMTLHCGLLAPHTVTFPCLLSVPPSRCCISGFVWTAATPLQTRVYCHSYRRAAVAERHTRDAAAAGCVGSMPSRGNTTSRTPLPVHYAARAPGLRPSSGSRTFHRPPPLYLTHVPPLYCLYHTATHQAAGLFLATAKTPALSFHNDANTTPRRCEQDRSAMDAGCA